MGAEARRGLPFAGDANVPRAALRPLCRKPLLGFLGHTVVTTWKLQAPNKLEYSIRDGAGGIVIGGKRWDREKPGAAWKESTSTMLPQPVSPWGARVANAYLLRTTPTRVTLSWYDPGVPSWFIGTFDRATAALIELRMTATAHFMQHRYLGFNRGVRIVPPT